MTVIQYTFFHYFISDLDEDFVISPSVDTRVQKNSLVTLRCKSPAGNPSPAVSWRKDDNPVDTHKNRRLLVKSQRNSSLVVIRKVKLSDGGDYSCVATNLVGRRESAIIKLNVYGKFTTRGYLNVKPFHNGHLGNRGIGLYTRGYFGSWSMP